MSDVAEKQRVAAYALIVEGGSVLLCRLTAGTSSAGQWTLPGGGLEFGEDPEAALRREVREETGLDVLSAELESVGSEVIPGENCVHHALRIVYRVRAEGSLSCEVDGSTDLCAWVPINAARDMPLVPFAKALIESLARGAP